jgi:threonyl-tRNA synthetase
LLRVRSFTQDDAHIYCTESQIEEEVLKIINMTYTVYKKFGFEKITVGVSTKPEKSMGSQEWWDKATQALKNALQRAGLAYEIYEGEGAFYGPKIEFGIEDSMKRKWQCGTVQVDPFLPENFDLTYVASTGTKERPIMVHRAIYGSMERFFAILLEHYKGLYPFWLAPVQVRVLTITDEQKEYAATIVAALKKAGIRTEMDMSSDPLSGQIKVAQLDKIPWMIVLGKKEVEQNTVTLRYFDGKQEFGVTLDGLLEKAAQANK